MTLRQATSTGEIQSHRKSLIVYAIWYFVFELIKEIFKKWIRYVSDHPVTLQQATSTGEILSHQKSLIIYAIQYFVLELIKELNEDWIDKRVHFKWAPYGHVGKKITRQEKR